MTAGTCWHEKDMVAARSNRAGTCDAASDGCNVPFGTRKANSAVCACRG